ncbi:MAG TPA: sigma-70 family RNA polymerase sigma factor [Steroidobacter sp.]|uniref:RNA polymerase sigma factor n=1 Tax=Steroidobacter sp. TaxID=1978227 RepID=UPI002ED85A38
MSDRTEIGDDLDVALDDVDRARWFMRHILPHEPALRGWLSRRRAPGAFDVDDIVQESYALLAERERLDDILNPRAYLFQVAHSLVVRNIRRARIVPILAVEDLGVVDLPDDAATPEQNAIAHDDLRQLATVIASMPGQTREAFVLRRVRGLSQREIASQMGLSENTVEKHIVRGIRWLGDWFANGGNPPAKTSNKFEPEKRRASGRARNQPGH